MNCELRCSVDFDLAGKLIKIGSVARPSGGGASRFSVGHSCRPHGARPFPRDDPAQPPEAAAADEDRLWEAAPVVQAPP
jgi:hypothetical protein